MKYSIEEIATSKAYLKKVFRKGIEAYCHVVSVSASGMSRTIKIMVPFKTKQGNLTILDISKDVAIVCGQSFNNKNWGVTVKGCGMDVAYWLISEVSREIGRDITKRSI